MKNQTAYDAIKASVVALNEAIGPLYQTCYLYGSLAQGLYQPDQSDINLLIIVDDRTDMHEVRAALKPIWVEYGDVLRRAPGIATQSAFQRHMLLNPILARHIDRFGKQVKGSKKALYQTSPLDKTRYLARMAARSLVASQALAPQLMPDESQRLVPLTELRRLIRQIRRGPVGQDETAVSLFHELQTFLHQQMTQLGIALPEQNNTGSAPYDVPGLRAIYERMGNLVLVVDKLPHLTQTDFDWEKLAAQVPPEYIGLQLVTPAQLQLAVEYEFALEYSLQNFRHIWGERLIEKLEPPVWAVLRDAARFVSDIQIYDLPHAYITAVSPDGDDEQVLRKIIHDFQNKLLNARLQNELLSRLKFVDRYEPPTPLPDRTAPSQERLAGILNQLNEWSEFYKEGMLSAV